MPYILAKVDKDGHHVPMNLWDRPMEEDFVGFEPGQYYYFQSSYRKCPARTVIWAIYGWILPGIDIDKNFVGEFVVLEVEEKEDDDDEIVDENGNKWVRVHVIGPANVTEMYGETGMETETGVETGSEFVVVNGRISGVVTHNGSKAMWWQEGRLHRDDLPAVMNSAVDQTYLGWWKHGRRHRADDLPARIFNNDNMEWYFEGHRHRDGNRPAQVLPMYHTTAWYVNGFLHRDDGDEPAYISDEGHERIWAIDGRYHRTGDNPAIIRRDGTMIWYVQHKCHREGDQPAAIFPDSREWWVDGVRHREGDEPALVKLEYDSQRREWWTRGLLHRDGDQPAVITKNAMYNTSEWWVQGELHRDGDQPAVVEETLYGWPLRQEWWLHGVLHRDNDLAAIVLWSINKSWDPKDPTEIRNQYWWKNDVMYKTDDEKGTISKPRYGKTNGILN